MHDDEHGMGNAHSLKDSIRVQLGYMKQSTPWTEIHVKDSKEASFHTQSCKTKYTLIDIHQHLRVNIACKTI